MAAIIIQDHFSISMSQGLSCDLVATRSAIEKVMIACKISCLGDAWSGICVVIVSAIIDGVCQADDGDSGLCNLVDSRQLSQCAMKAANKRC